MAFVSLQMFFLTDSVMNQVSQQSSGNPPFLHHHSTGDLSRKNTLSAKLVTFLYPLLCNEESVAHNNVPEMENCN